MSDIPPIKSPNLTSPEIIPGGYVTGNQWRKLQDWANQVGNTINQILNIEPPAPVVGAASGPGLDGAFFVVGQTTQDEQLVSDTALQGMTPVALGRDGQIVVCWRSQRVNIVGVGVPHGSLLLTAMALPPYDHWTAFDFTTLSASLIAETAVDNADTSQTVSVCADIGSGDLFYCYWDWQAGDSDYPQLMVCRAEYDPLNLNFTLQTPVVVRVVNQGKKAASQDIYGPLPGVLLLTLPTTPPVTASPAQCAVLRSVGAPPGDVWQTQVEYNGYLAGGTRYWFGGQDTLGHGNKVVNATALVDLGGGRILLLMEITDDDISTANSNLAWSLSPDYGASWDVDDGAGFQAAVGQAGTRTGLLFPADTSTGKFTTSNLRPGGYVSGQNPRHWAATSIPGTSRVALVYAGNANNGVAGGLRYAEFDADQAGGLGAWTAPAAHVRLSAYATECQPIVLAQDDGVIRVIWLHGTNEGRPDAALSAPVLSLQYVETDGSSPLDAGSWTTPYDAVKLPVLAALNASPYLATNHLRALPQGFVIPPAGPADLPDWGLVYTRWYSTRCTDIAFKPYGVGAVTKTSPRFVPGSIPLPLAFWRMEALGPTQNDELHGLALVGQGSASVPTQVAGILGHAVHVAAANSQSLYHAMAVNDLPIQGGGTAYSFTIGLWVYPDTLAASTLVYKGLTQFGPSTTDLEYYIDMDASGETVFHAFASSTVNAYVQAAGALVSGAWNCLLFWWDKDKNLLGGSLNGSAAMYTPYSGGIKTGTRDMRVGAGNGDGPLAFNFFDGRIDCLSYWHRVLTLDERGAWFNQGLAQEYVNGAWAPGGQ